MSSLNVFKTWHGEDDIATLVNHAGFSIKDPESKMFDNDSETFWHSSFDHESDEKKIGIEFKVYFCFQHGTRKHEIFCENKGSTVKYTVQAENIRS